MESAYVARCTHIVQRIELQVNYISWYIRCLFKSTSMHAAATFNISRYIASFKANKSLFLFSYFISFARLATHSIECSHRFSFSSSACSSTILQMRPCLRGSWYKEKQREREVKSPLAIITFVYMIHETVLFTYTSLSLSLYTRLSLSSFFSDTVKTNYFPCICLAWNNAHVSSSFIMRYWVSDLSTLMLWTWASLKHIFSLMHLIITRDIQLLSISLYLW